MFFHVILHLLWYLAKIFSEFLSDCFPRPILLLASLILACVFIMKAIIMIFWRIEMWVSSISPPNLSLICPLTKEFYYRTGFTGNAHSQTHRQTQRHTHTQTHRLNLILSLYGTQNSEFFIYLKDDSI